MTARPDPMNDPDPPPIRWRLHLRASPASVLAYLTEPALMARWWAEAVRVEGGAVHLAFPDGSELRVVLRVDAEARRVEFEYFDGCHVAIAVRDDGGAGTDLELVATGVQAGEWQGDHAGWVSVLLALKAAVDFGVDLRNHDRARTWREGYADN